MTDLGSPATANGRQIPAWIPTVGPGWAALLTDLHARLCELDEEYQVEDFSVDSGRLRLHVADRYDATGEVDVVFADAAVQLIDDAVRASAQTCDRCGAPGRPRFRGRGRSVGSLVRCDDCRTAPPVQPRPEGARTRPVQELSASGRC
ncbi:MAG TPA: hypothetical protein VE546_02755 [Streptomyces sp.]|uniref:hypothetical protein n=1 Tax=Streptomyces sp. TaxID=1931 RepID=UPI002D2CAC80|nr:hypothetical protein [Streptomyces sp.]HZG02493.1 hypothetical protein [Streptomyces sp.]